MLFSASHQTSSRSRVVVTGVGVITALGTGWKENAEGFRRGRVAIGPVTLFDTSRHRVKVAAEVRLPAVLPQRMLSSPHQERLDRAGKMLLIAADEAWKQSGWQPSEELPIVLGTTSAGMSLGQSFYRQAIDSPGTRRRQASRVRHYQAQRQALDLIEEYGFSGSVTIIGNACASGANAIGHAWELISSGAAERVLTGGYDALSEMVFSGFDALQALSPISCRPFDLHRDGLALGEGAAVLAMETMESAQRRGVKILGEIAGYGASTDQHHLTQPHPEGQAAYIAMQSACQSAGVRPEQIQYVNAHGTGTVLNDSAEAAAINRWAGTHAPDLAVSSTKSAVGHLLGAAGAVETVVCLMALAEQWFPPTSTLRDKDPVCMFRVVQEPSGSNLEFAMTNSFGFGGANASLVLRRSS